MAQPALTTQTPGPYWINISGGEHQVCGRNGKIMFRYPAEQAALADHHLKSLQKGYTRRERAIQDLAPDMLDLIVSIEESFTADNSYAALRQACRDLLAKVSV